MALNGSQRAFGLRDACCRSSGLAEVSPGTLTGTWQGATKQTAAERSWHPSASLVRPGDIVTNAG